MDKELRLVLEEVLDLFEANEEELLDWKVFKRLMEATDRNVWSLDEWMEVQEFVAEAIRTALAKEA